MRQITAILAGAGSRGADTYGSYALQFPNELKIVGVAEPRQDRLEAFAQLHGVSPDRCYNSWEELLQQPKFADCVFVCTPDHLHFAPVMAALEQGYHVLCEKPMSGNGNEIRAMAQKADQCGKILSVCHVLRYSPFFAKIKSLLDQGAVGDLICIQHIEAIGYWHMAHSFVRGNWRRQDESNPIILAKCCHDMDLLSWLVGSRCKTVSSFGSLSHFRPENKPVGAPDRCMDGCPHRDSCPYYAPRFYLEDPRAQATFVKIISLDTSRQGLLQALQTGPYGRCVYACDNDVADHQVVNLLYENGVTVNMTMSAFTEQMGRVINLMGSHGQIQGNLESNTVEYWDFISGEHQVFHLKTYAGGHSGSDHAMMKSFVALLREEQGNSLTSATASVESHLMALAAEESRLHNGCPMELDWN